MFAKSPRSFHHWVSPLLRLLQVVSLARAWYLLKQASAAAAAGAVNGDGDGDGDGGGTTLSQPPFFPLPPTPTLLFVPSSVRSGVCAGSDADSQGRRDKLLVIPRLPLPHCCQRHRWILGAAAAAAAAAAAGGGGGGGGGDGAPD
ncbi:unnamed protein product [Closterium sp. NIES-64]|nr:unnamed protein product [Closterium sp. NIES-64]